ncbi:choline kinase alpha [Trichonephila inaurata madagascariensis]|uniref:Choline kinase alpha n=1 Tax=Trichonephila inaurata madagascariensis TaxID=2747483 RepID=A0A8X6YRR1_9ARAC|nr:choline kinase alpha [Trichonephila inaurata madagascariensis]
MRHMKKFFKDVENVMAERSKDPFELGDWYLEETKWLYEEIKKTKSPLVYCHNDLQGGNILLRQDIPSKENYKLMLIDFEFGAYNYRGFDLANQFVEWCFDYNTEEYPHYVVNFDQFPSKQEQISFATAYLNQLVEEQVIPAGSRGRNKKHCW